MLSVNDLRSIISYDPETGLLTWLVDRGPTTLAGTPAGAVSGEGYHRVCISGRRYTAHRIGWALHYGAWPDGDIDHVNRVKSDNRIENLRIATKQQNSANTPPIRDGYKGVVRQHRKWHARIRVNGRHLTVGVCSTEIEAAKAYDCAARLHFGEFAYLNFPDEGGANA